MLSALATQLHNLCILQAGLPGLPPALPASTWFRCCLGRAVCYLQGWRNFEGHIPPAERGDIVAAYHQRLTSPDTAVRDAAVSLSPGLAPASCALCDQQLWRPGVDR